MSNNQPKLTVTKLPGTMPLVIKQEAGASFFITSKDSIVIDVAGLTFLVKFLVTNGMMDHKILEGILEEFNSD